MAYNDSPDADLIPSFVEIFFLCVMTVFMDIQSSSAISLLIFPPAIRRRTSFSLADNSPGKIHLVADSTEELPYD